MSVANADWDAQMHANEKAKYGCYDSGQGCGSGTHELTLSASMVQSTEGASSGYYVKDWNIDMNDGGSSNGNYLLNAEADGANAGNGIGTDTLIHSSATLSGISHSMQGGEAEYHTIALPESLAILEMLFLTCILMKMVCHF